MRTHFNNLLAFSLILLTWACTVPEPKEQKVLEANFYNPAHQRIWEFKDQQLIDSLYLNLKNDDPTIRQLASHAFSSLDLPAQASDSLAYLLKDPVPEVRAAAAFAIGQLGHPVSEIYLTDAFERLDSLNKWNESNQKILEAIGKCGSEKSLQALSTLQTYRATDSILLNGQIKGIFNFGQRKIYSDQSIAKAIDFINETDYPQDARTLAAHYLSRAPAAYLTNESLQSINLQAQNPNIKMALAIALGKVSKPTSRPKIEALLEPNQDYRVRLNAIRALGNFPYDSIHQTLITALSDPNKHVQKVAADQLIQNGDERYAKMYYRLAKDTFPLLIKSKLLTAANRHLPNYFVETKNAINRQLQQFVEGNFSPQSKLQAIEGLSYDRWNYRYILQQTTHHPEAAMRTAGAQAIKRICAMGDFRGFYGGNYRRVRQEIADSLKVILLSADDGPVYEASGILNIEDLGFNRIIENDLYLDTALQRLVLPRQTEAYEALRKEISLFRTGETVEAQKPSYNYPIDWSQLEDIRNDQKIIIRTNKGDIILSMLPDLAPATVINFIKLVKSNYYKNNQFHRVVSNFVIQGGCPRGDGYGSLDHSIRSEFSDASYEAGYVGMASAGPDTECSQFFITHAQTPHLDGRYTIFAKVSEGMDVVHQIQQGDQILDIEFLN